MSVPNESLSTPESVHDTLVSLAATHEITLDNDRMEWLVEAGQKMALCERVGYPPSAYTENGIVIQPPKYKPETDTYVSKIDFTPYVKGQEVHKQTRDNVAGMGARGIVALQNYVLLMELTGLQPDALRGITNPAMAGLAANFGFAFQETESKTKNPIIQADYKDLANAAFSPRIKRVESILLDWLSRETPVSQKIQEVIDAKGIKVDPERLEWLIKVASIHNSGGSFWEGESFYKDGFGIGITLENIAGRKGSTVSTVDFSPKIDGRPTHDPSVRNRDHISSIGLMGIRAMQDYVILVDAGYVTRTDLLASWTNWPVARMAGKFGFDITRRREIPRVEADYEAFAEAVFSDDIRNLEVIFEDRLTRQ